MTSLDTLCSPRWSPFALTVNGTTWRGATDGHMFLALATPGATPAGAAPGQVAGWLAERPGGLPVSLAALREWAGPPLPPHIDVACACGSKPVPCRECKGSGRRQCECDCGNVHEAPCSECTNGTEECEECSPTGVVRTETPASPGEVRVGGRNMVFDRMLLARLLACVPDGGAVTVALVGSDLVLALWGDGWHGRLCGTRVEPQGAPFMVAP